ncbi:MAG: hypothetical protein ABIQ08_05415, partial [Duganella sp.]
MIRLNLQTVDILLRVMGRYRGRNRLQWPRLALALAGRDRAKQGHQGDKQGNNGSARQQLAAQSDEFWG